MKAQVIVFLPSIQNGILVPGIGVAKLEHLGINTWGGALSLCSFQANKQSRTRKKFLKKYNWVLVPQVKDLD